MNKDKNERKNLKTARDFGYWLWVWSGLLLLAMLLGAGLILIFDHSGPDEAKFTNPGFWVFLGVTVLIWVLGMAIGRAIVPRVKVLGKDSVTTTAPHFQDREMIPAGIRIPHTPISDSTTEFDSLIDVLYRELRDPLHHVFYRAGLLLTTELNGEQREYASDIAAGADSLLAVINNIIDYSNISSGVMDLQTLDFDLHSTVEDIGNIMSLKSFSGNNRYDFAMDPAVPALLIGDPGRLRQILINIATYITVPETSGNFQLQMRLDKETDSEAVIRFVFRGKENIFNQSAVDFLFQPMSKPDVAKLHQSIQEQKLGLRIAKQLIGLMNGRFDHVIKDGNRSISIIFPFKKQKPVSMVMKDRELSLKGIKILVAEANARTRNYLKTILLEAECEVVDTADTIDALKLINKAQVSGNPFNVMITDMQIPPATGEGLGRQISKQIKAKSLKMVMLTSIGFRGDAERMRKIGFDAYLMKPVNKTTFLECIMMLISKDSTEPLIPDDYLITQYTVDEVRKRQIRILLTGDRKEDRNAILQTSEKLGYSAHVEKSAKPAFENKLTEKFRIVVVDLTPENLETLTKNKSIISESNTWFVGISDEITGTLRKACEGIGLKGCLTRPVSSVDVAGLIKSWVETWAMKS